MFLLENRAYNFKKNLAIVRYTSSIL